MTIKFKNVGQGDSILISWSDNSTERYGIIDCNLLDVGNNPIVKELSTISSIAEIEFIILSHPHYDHYSGLQELLEFCDTNSIQIKFFLHTSSSIPEFLRASTRTLLEASKLSSLFKTIDSLYGKTIRDVGIVNATSGIFRLNEIWSMQFLSPSYDEQREFNRLISRAGSHPYKSNLLSTLIRIYSNNRHILLTSDVEAKSFKRIVMKDFHSFFSKSNLMLGQISHHGADVNYYDTFWRKQIKREGCPAVISVGENTYGHPSEKIVSTLTGHGYQVDMTNFYATQSAKAIDLDLVSSLEDVSKYDLSYSV